MTFKPGQSGNPSGTDAAKRKQQKQIKELLAKYVPEAVEAIGRMLKDPDYMQFATKEVLDRVYGKAAQTVDVGGEAGQALTAVLQIVARDKKE